MGYAEFLHKKTQLGGEHGFIPLEIPEFLFPFQKDLVDWAIRKGRAAIFADCGLGKTPMQLAWADNVIRHTGKPVLILTPLAVAGQTLREAQKFGFMADHSRNGEYYAPIAITNYEKLHLFKPDDFAGVVCDESSILKNFDGKTKAAATEFMRTIPYRLLCTATAAPNDFDELGTSAEALGEMGYQDMLTRFFRDETKKERPFYVHAWSRQAKKVLKGHAERDFWRWVCSWARACRKPSDLGYEDDGFVLPGVDIREHVVEAKKKRPGYLFDLPAITLNDQREERRRTIEERCCEVAKLVDHGNPVVAWCHLNPEGDLLEKLIPGAVQVSGSDSDDEKEEKFLDFQSGKTRVMITKPIIGAWGLNWQHCAHQVFFPSHSFEQWYQAKKRSDRFGQTRIVQIDLVTSEGERGVMANLQRKQEQAEIMFTKLVELMNDHLRIEKSAPFSKTEEVPTWLSTSN